MSAPLRSTHFVWMRSGGIYGKDVGDLLGPKRAQGHSRKVWFVPLQAPEGHVEIRRHLCSLITTTRAEVLGDALGPGRAVSLPHTDHIYVTCLDVIPLGAASQEPKDSADVRKDLPGSVSAGAPQRLSGHGDVSAHHPQGATPHVCICVHMYVALILFML